jgi:ribosome-associated toxin RatA of RatAB toxin-antitoxin module
MALDLFTGRSRNGRRQRFARAAGIALIVVAGVVPAAAATIIVSAQRDGEFIAIHARAELDADAATAWRVLTDYNRYPEFIPDLRMSRVVSRKGATVTVEQSGDATVWLFRMPLEVTFEISETPQSALSSRAIAGSMRALESRYTLVPGPSGVNLEYAGRVAPGYELFGRIEQYAVRQNVARQFQALVDEIERYAAAGRAHSAAVPR